MKILVTGGDGQVGRCLAERAAKIPKISLVAPARDALDISDRQALAMAMRGVEPDLVINAAAFTAVDAAEDEPERAHAVNAEAAGQVAWLARAAGARLIQLSTDYVFDGTGSAPIGEDRPTAPLGAYGRSKLAGEQAVHAQYPEATIVRTAWLCSAHGGNFVTTILKAARDRDALDVVADQVGSPTSAHDLADALLAIAARRDGTGQGQVYHAVNAGRASWADVAEHVLGEAAARGLPSAEVRRIGSDQWPARAPRPRWSVLDTGKLRADFGIALPDWRPSFASIVATLAAREA